MQGYILYRKDDRSALVLKDMDDDELSYILRKLERTRVKWLRNFAKELLKDFFEKTNAVEEVPQVRIVQSGFHKDIN